jgi:demethylmenaquinone methyltransferase/2-methoxy-6-polyprenyl-1,4-benzoquinol methylase
MTRLCRETQARWQTPEDDFMANTEKGDVHDAAVRRMFGCVARRYDLLNRLMTFGQDLRWRRLAARKLGPGRGERLLDVGAGTGDMSLALLRRAPQAMIVAVDFTPQMLQRGMDRTGGLPIAWVLGDAAHLPFCHGAFHGIASAFLLRNLGHITLALDEQFRVLRQGGRFVALETTPPAPSLWRPLLRLYLRHIIPFLGRLVAGNSEAYRYLPSSTESFLTPEGLAEMLGDAGFGMLGFRRLMFGSLALHWARRSH